MSIGPGTPRARESRGARARHQSFHARLGGAYDEERLVALGAPALARSDERLRVFPLSNWTELDIWHYIDLENIPVALGCYSLTRTNESRARERVCDDPYFCCRGIPTSPFDVEQYFELHQQKGLLRFLACGCVDDGKSALIGRLFALYLDGLAAEREEEITIDVAYRFFSTERGLLDR